ncbi:MAG TPA: aminotransferase class IV [Geothrix sp.]|nr:aminotransferase class IV [Geothrix sp.]
MEGSFPRTALPVVQGVPRHLDAHLQRLEAGASALGRPADWLPGLRSGLEAWLRSSLSGEDAALRMVLNLDQGVLCAKLEALPAAPKPCRLALMPHPLGARRADPRIVHKGLAGPWSAGILAKARAQGAEDALLSWPDGSLAETAIASIGIQIGQTLLMPPSPGRVASVAERLDLPIWAQARGLRIEQEILSLAQARAGQLWCLNALRGVWPATLL